MNHITKCIIFTLLPACKRFYLYIHNTYMYKYMYVIRDMQNNFSVKLSISDTLLNELHIILPANFEITIYQPDCLLDRNFYLSMCTDVSFDMSIVKFSCWSFYQLSWIVVVGNLQNTLIKTDWLWIARPRRSSMHASSLCDYWHVIYKYINIAVKFAITVTQFWFWECEREIEV